MSKIVFISGASKGIGLEIAHIFSKNNYQVIGTSRGNFSLDKLIDDSNAISVKLDVTNRNEIESLYKELKDQKLLPDILINNAGVTNDQLFLRMTYDQWDQTINTNLNGVFNLTKVFIKNMIKNKYGRIINISSVAGLMGNAGQVNYASSKSALLGFTKSIAKEMGARNITSNIIAPGFIKTDMTNVLDEAIQTEIKSKIPLKSFGDPTDIAQTALFLASENADYISGQTISIDGGLFID
ncbi:MAG: 3-oxoacyl-ACP reductase FabG [Pseudomonadota bacterium]|jgi:3-oxoacyl-[acyl-carrier protein] reductase|nr:3-oxoacyl-ACP reductase FabG [Pseudomonadota bacterium]|tara:strand:- start:757 stop:1476 length:720 start_codon:yes stop_codon:yes gene_type:complete